MKDEKLSNYSVHKQFALILLHRDVADAFKLAEAIKTEVQKLKIPHVKSEVSNYVCV